MRARKAWIVPAALLLCGLLAMPVRAAEPAAETVKAKAAVLMEASTGEILWQKEAHEPLPPASVTKVMTLLLGLEAVERGEARMDDVAVVSAYAASMGGSQVYMAEGERFTLEELFKCIAVPSANDACVVLAEHLCGSVGAFVEKMNRRARELGCADTTFVNCTGLPADGHRMSAADIAVISRELISHPEIFRFTTIWTDSIRGGAFELSNTNKMLRTFRGANGLKTGFTSEAGYCVSATAERDGMSLIAVVLGGAASEERFSDAAALLEYGFSAYTIAPDELAIPDVRVSMGCEPTVRPARGAGAAPVIRREQAGEIRLHAELPDRVSAPVRAGQKLGELVWTAGEETICRVPLVAGENVERIGFREIFRRLMMRLFFLPDPA